MVTNIAVLVEMEWESGKGDVPVFGDLFRQRRASA